MSDVSNVDAPSFVVLDFSFVDNSIWIGGENALGKSEITTWLPSASVFREVLDNCFEHYFRLSNYPGDGHELLILIETSEEDSPIYIWNATQAQEFYENLPSDLSPVETGYEAIKEYINSSSVGEGNSVDASSLESTQLVTLYFSFEDRNMWLLGVNAQGTNEMTLWSPSESAFLEVLKNCLEDWNNLSAYLSDGYEFLITVKPAEDEDYVFISDADSAQAAYEIFSGD